MRNESNPPIMDFEIRRDGGRWVFYHHAKKNAVAVYTGDGSSIDAAKALKLYLITRRMMA